MLRGSHMDSIWMDGSIARWIDGWTIMYTADVHFLVQLLVCWEYDHRAQERTLLPTTKALKLSHSQPI